MKLFTLMMRKKPSLKNSISSSGHLIKGTERISRSGRSALAACFQDGVNGNLQANDDKKYEQSKYIKYSRNIFD